MTMSKKIPAFFTAVLFTALFTIRAGSEVIDKIAVVVNDEIVTEGEIERMLMPVYEQYKSRYQGNELFAKLEEARQKVMEQLIDDRLLLSEAKKSNIEVSDGDVEAKISDAISHFPSREEFEKALAGQSITLKELRSRYKDQLMTRRLVDQKIGAKILITPVEISNYYNAHISDFAQPGRFKLANILIKAGDDPEKALEKTTDILEKLKAGSDFYEMAKTYSEGPAASEGGVMGYVKNDELMPQIQKAVAGLKEGEISGIVETSLGYHIFKMEKIDEARTLSVSEARRTIEETLFRERMNKKIKEFVQGLKKNAYIAFK